MTAVALDVTDAASIAAAAASTDGISILVNNAGSSTGASVTGGAWSDTELEMNTHYSGTLAVTRAFAPQLAQSGTSAVLNILSVLSWFNLPGTGAYSAAKAAEWSLTNALRLELAGQGTTVSGLHVGFMDTDMVRHIDAPESDPAVIAAVAIDAIAAGQVEIVADDISHQVRSGLAGGVAALYPQLV